MNERPIKFRAWNNITGTHKMDYLSGFTYCGKQDKHIQAFFIRDGGFFTAPIEHVVLMQFTGMVDVNGIDVYEGDVVRLTYRDEQSEVFKVVWDEEKCRFELCDNIGEAWSFTTQNTLQVTGNIYANPDQFSVNF